MTPEQLDEIEKLAETRLMTGGSADARILATVMLETSKALREALIAADAANRERADWMHSLDRSKIDIITLMRERDEARAEAARWKEHLRHIAYEHCDSPVHYAMNQLEKGE